MTLFMNNSSSHFIFIFLITLSLTACQSFNATDQHPLIDKIWSVTEQKYISIDTLNAQFLQAEAVLLGETHDNIRHHQLQAQVIDELVKNHRRPTVAFEMLDQNQQDSIAQFQKEHAGSQDKTDALARVINWEQSGWPEWSYYRPVFHSVMENNLPIVAANLNIKLIRKVIKQGSQVLDSNYQTLLTRYQYNEVVKKQLAQEILSAHCDMLPEKMLSPMLLGQQVRDLAMTQALQSSLAPSAASSEKLSGGVVLIAGSGHIRKDYAVPYYLQQEMPELNILSLAFIEVSEEMLKPSDYAAAWNTQNLPFDIIWFTSRAEREDQCEKMKAYMKKKKSK